MKRIIIKDSLEALKELPDKSVNCIITSPPYYGLRDYGVKGQIGLEETPEDYIEKLVKVFHEAKRVLRDDGTLWVNIGDSYSGGGRGRSTKLENVRFSDKSKIQKGNVGSALGNVPYRNLPKGTKPKDLIGIPWMLAFALRADGWYLRQDIIWHKPNPMPESVKDRCTKSHEYIFLLSKNPHYYFDYEAIQEEAKPESEARYKSVFNKGKDQDASRSKYISIEQESSVRQGMNKDRGNGIIAVRKNLPNQQMFVSLMRRNTSVKELQENTNISQTTIEHWFRTDEKGFSYPSIKDWLQIRDYVDDWSKEFQSIDQGMTEVTYETDAIDKNNDGMRNKRDVWSVTTKGYKEAHFATFPEDLIEPCILAGCPEDGVVLDTFCGSGTTGVVSVRNKRNFIGIELNPEYAEISERRIAREESYGIQTTMF